MARGEEAAEAAAAAGVGEGEGLMLAVLLPSDLLTILLGLLEEGVTCRTTMLLAGVPALLRLLSTLLLLLLEVPGRTALPAVLPGKWA